MTDVTAKDLPPTASTSDAVKLRSILLLAFLICAGLFSQYYFEDRSGESKVFIFSRAGAVERSIDVNARLVAIDPVKGDVVVRLGFAPKGLADEFGVLTTLLVLDVNSSTGRTDYDFSEGRPMAPVDVTLSLEGKAQRYPFDKHSSALNIMATEFDEEKRPYPVPLKVSISSELAGYRVAIDKSEIKSRPEFCRLDLVASRSTSVLAFDLFVMIVMGALGISTLLVTRAVILGRKAELPLFQWMATLLFALLPLRNSMPGSPPLGTLGDYLAFFWAESLVAVSLLLLVRTWLKRP